MLRPASSRSRIVRRSLALALLVAGSPAWAQGPGGEAGDIEDFSLEDLLNPTVSTATKSKRSLEQSPSIVSVFLREDIERLQVRQLIDLLAHVPGFYEVSSQLERNVAIRGVHASAPYHFVVLLDGLPMNDFLFSSSSPDNFSLELAERVEIIRGPGSAIYGANALMGVVNIISRKPDRNLRLQQSVHAGTGGHLRADLSAWHATASGSFVGSVSVWRQDGTPFAVGPDEDLLAPSPGAGHLRWAHARARTSPRRWSAAAAGSTATARASTRSSSTKPTPARRCGCSSRAAS